MRVLTSELSSCGCLWGYRHTCTRKAPTHSRGPHDIVTVTTRTAASPAPPIRNPPGYLGNANPGVPGGPPAWNTHRGGVLAQLHAAVPLPQGFISADRRVRDLGRCRPRVRAAQAFPTGSGSGFWGRSHCSGLSGALPHLTHTTGQLPSHRGQGHLGSLQGPEAGSHP